MYFYLKLTWSSIPPAKLENKRQKNLMICTNHIAYTRQFFFTDFFAQAIETKKCVCVCVCVCVFVCVRAC